jgi:sulfite oxidase
MPSLSEDDSSSSTAQQPRPLLFATLPALSRRDWLGLSWGGLVSGLSLAPFSQALGLAGRQPPSPNDGRLIARSLRPLNLESPLAALETWLTPNEQFFVRSHFGAPAVDLHPWELEISGLVGRPDKLTLAKLLDQPQVSLPAVLQCSGNGRALFRPRMPGVGWERGAVGQAEWSGVRLGDLLHRAGLKPGAAHVHFIGGDAPPSPKTPAFIRSIPLDRALEPNTLLALRMNGEPLPPLHGGPVRLAVPGWAGNNWIKWVRKLIVAREEAPGFYMQTAYRLPMKPLPAGVTLKPEDLAPVNWLNVKSLITHPHANAVLAQARHEVRGVAWTGQGHVTAVEFATDRDPRWRPTMLVGEPRAGSWRQFKFGWQPDQPGQYVLRVRATDSLGQVQPEKTVWNKSGYLWNGIDEVACVVR